MTIDQRKISFNHRTQRQYFEDPETNLKRRSEVRIHRTFDPGLPRELYWENLRQLADYGTPSLAEVQEWCGINIQTPWEAHRHAYCDQDYVALIFDAPPTRMEKVALKLRFG